jgi:hypothetical protein
VTAGVLRWQQLFIHLHLMALVQAARVIARRAASSWVATQQATHQAAGNLQQSLPALQQLQAPLQQQQQRYASLGITLPSPLRLDEVMRVPLLEDKTTEEVEAIWLEVGGGSRNRRLHVCCSSRSSQQPGTDLTSYQQLRLSHASQLEVDRGPGSRSPHVCCSSSDSSSSCSSRTSSSSRSSHPPGTDLTSYQQLRLSHASQLEVNGGPGSRSPHV